MWIIFKHFYKKFMVIQTIRRGEKWLSIILKLIKDVKFKLKIWKLIEKK